MKIAGIQKVSLVDFDGHISTTLFTAGCNFACPFCHNAGIVREYEPILPMQDIMAYLEKRKKVLDAVVITGGEPTIHSDLPDFIKTIKDMGYLVKLDTNGTNPELLEELILDRKIDYVAMDVKSCLSKYPQVCGNPYVNTDNIWNSIQLIKNSGIEYEFRTTVTDDNITEEDFTELCEMISGCSKYYIQRFQRTQYVINQDCKVPSDEKLQKFLEIAKQYIENVSIR
jgi:pyruvate formate lyase activating enzyme